jgi:hypothetical protein
MGEGRQILKFEGGEEIKPCTECTYLGTSYKCLKFYLVAQNYC